VEKTTRRMRHDRVRPLPADELVTTAPESGHPPGMSGRRCAAQIPSRGGNVAHRPDRVTEGRRGRPYRRHQRDREYLLSVIGDRILQRVDAKFEPAGWSGFAQAA